MSSCIHVRRQRVNDVYLHQNPPTPQTHFQLESFHPEIPSHDTPEQAFWRVSLRCVTSYDAKVPRTALAQSYRQQTPNPKQQLYPHADPHQAISPVKDTMRYGAQGPYTTQTNDHRQNSKRQYYPDVGLGSRQSISSPQGTTSYSFTQGRQLPTSTPKWQPRSKEVSHQGSFSPSNTSDAKLQSIHCPSQDPRQSVSTSKRRRCSIEGLNREIPLTRGATRYSPYAASAKDCRKLALSPNNMTPPPVPTSPSPPAGTQAEGEDKDVDMPDAPPLPIKERQQDTTLLTTQMDGEDIIMSETLQEKYDKLEKRNKYDLFLQRKSIYLLRSPENNFLRGFLEKKRKRISLRRIALKRQHDRTQQG